MRSRRCLQPGWNGIYNRTNSIANSEHPVGAVTPAEMGELVTAVCAVNAIGNAIAQFYIYPWKRQNSASLAGAVAGTVSGSGWMTSDIFSQIYLPVFIAQSRCSKENPILLLMDNHISHCSLNVLTKAKENGIVIQTLPPHCSHRLQPLDRTVYGPINRFYNRATDNWMRTNPSKAVSIWKIENEVARRLHLQVHRNLPSKFWHIHWSRLPPF